MSDFGISPSHIKEYQQLHDLIRSPEDEMVESVSGNILQW